MSASEVKETREKRRSRKATKSDVKNDASGDSLENKKAKPSEQEEKANARKLFYLEENSVEGRQLSQDVDIFKTSCDKLRGIMDKVEDLKECSTSADAKKEIAQLRKTGILEFVVLKRMNRMARFNCKAVREVTQEAKQKIDKHHLRLQNLLYEIMHLQKEISKCLDFKSHDEDISLVEVDEFYQDAPEEIAKPEVTRKDLHQQTLARLDWELEQRKRLSNQLTDKKTSKSELKKEIQSKQSYLESLQPKLNNILQATKPVQEHLDMPFDEIREQHKSASYLPRPLYVVYMQASAYRDACDKYIEVNIQGDLEEAKSLSQSTTALDEDSESEGEEQEKSGDNTKRRRHSMRIGVSTSSKQDKVLRKHPLSVHITIKCKDESVLSLKLNYLLVLEIVTVEVDLTPPKDMPVNSHAAGDLLSAENLLSCLYPDDHGLDTPNSANNYALQGAGITSLSNYCSRIGIPYRWLQSICGLHFLNVLEKPKVSDPRVNVTNLDATVRKLRRRVRGRVSLFKQLAACEKGSVSVSSEYQHLFPSKISSSLVSWKRSTHEDFAGCGYTQHIMQAGIVSGSDMFFSGFIERGSAKLSVQTVVSADYPLQAPVFALRVQWKKERMAMNDEHIRGMEAEVNIHYSDLMSEKSADQLLSNQLQRLLMCFDVYVESEAETALIEGPAEFAKERIFTKTTRGPHRCKPYKYNTQLGIFQQR